MIRERVRVWLRQKVEEAGESGLLASQIPAFWTKDHPSAGPLPLREIAMKKLSNLLHACSDMLRTERPLSRDGKLSTTELRVFLSESATASDVLQLSTKKGATFLDAEQLEVIPKPHSPREPLQPVQDGYPRRRAEHQNTACKEVAEIEVALKQQHTHEQNSQLEDTTQLSDGQRAKVVVVEEEEAGRLSFEVERYKGLLHDAQDNATRLEVKRAQIEEEIGAMQAAREEDAKRLAAGEERVVHLLGRLGTLEEEATSARAAVSGAEAKAVVLAESEARQVLSAKLESAEAERGRAGVELEQTKLLLRGSDAERAGLEEEASRLRAQVARTEEERTRMEEESVSLKAQLEEAGQELACNVTRVAHHTLESVFAQVGKLDVCLKMSQDCVGLVLSFQDKLSMLLSECQQNIVALQNTLEQVEAEKAQARQQVREQKEKSVRQAEELVAALEREHEWEAEREKALTDRAAALDLVEELNEHIKCVDVEMCGKVSN